jgi:hypothetical protein
MHRYQLPPNVAAYLKRRAVSDPWRINDSTSRLYDAAVVIPSLAESKDLPLTLHSLSLNPPGFLENTLIVVVINHRVDASNSEKSDNYSTLEALPLWQQRYRLENLRWVDAASNGHELPTRQGVGLARKIGLDLALALLNFAEADPLLICLDADTLVQPDYLSAVYRHFSGNVAGGASVPYRHRPADTQPGQAAVERYELFLRAYILGLQCAASPYAFHTVGSAMACRTSAYVNAGGMNRRQAGEDFYFLQQLYKTAGVEPLTGTVVYPSPRASQRVPFGTGRAVGDMLSGGKERLLFYQPAVFRIVGSWLECVKNSHSFGGEAVLDLAGQITPTLREFLEQAGFRESWDNLRHHTPAGDRLMTAFHGWFDAFKTMKLIHFLSNRDYPRVAPAAAVLPLLKSIESDCPAGVREQLDLLRLLQGA